MPQYHAHFSECFVAYRILLTKVAQTVASQSSPSTPYPQFSHGSERTVNVLTFRATRSISAPEPVPSLFVSLKNISTGVSNGLRNMLTPFDANSFQLFSLPSLSKTKKKSIKWLAYREQTPKADVRPSLSTHRDRAKSRDSWLIYLMWVPITTLETNNPRRTKEDKSRMKTNSMLRIKQQFNTSMREAVNWT